MRCVVCCCLVLDVSQDIQIAQISPEQEEQDGLPEQGLAETQEESSIDVALVSPEESAEQGFPLQEDSITSLNQQSEVVKDKCKPYERLAKKAAKRSSAVFLLLFICFEINC